MKSAWRLPFATEMLLRIAREVIRLRLVAIWWLSGIGGTIHCNDEHCWGDERGIDVYRKGKLHGTLCYGEGGNKYWVAWLNADCVESAAWSGCGTLELARRLREEAK